MWINDVEALSSGFAKPAMALTISYAIGSLNSSLILFIGG